MKSVSLTLLLSLLVQFAGVSQTLAQESSGADTSRASGCAFSLSTSGVSATATPRYENGRLVGVELLFKKQLVENLINAKFELTPQRMHIYSLWTETRISPTQVRRSVYEVAESNRPPEQVQSIYFATPPVQGRHENIGFVFLEGAARLDKKDIGRESNFGIQLPPSTKSEPNAVQTLSCPKGLKNWTPKDYLTSRLLSKDEAVGLEAAVELIGSEDTAEPGSLMLASYWINKAGNPKLAMATYYKSMYRLKFVPERYSAVFMPYVIGATAPIVADYAVLNVPQMIQALHEVLAWDEKTFLEWTVEMGFDPNDDLIKKNRNAIKMQTLKLIADLQADPKKFERQLRQYTDPYL